MSAEGTSDPIYVMGRSAEERERLMQQADLLGSRSERFFRDAGIVPGMRVLDVGCGVGDIALLCGRLVGPEGAVVGVDRDPAALAKAQERIADSGLSHVQLQEGDFRELPAAEPFDAVVGRAVLMYAADPAEAVRALLPQLRRSGIVAFQEFDFTNLMSAPPLPLFEQIAGWWRSTASQAGIELQMGLKLFATYRAAGLPAPDLTADTLIGGGPDFAGYTYLAGVVRSILPLTERFGIATASEVDVDTLAERLREQAVAGGGVILLQMTVGAASRTP
jgi:SAM-dependent methyltransferase